MLRELVEKLPMVAYVDMLDGRTLYVSPQVEEMLGYPTEAWLDDPDLLFTVLHPDDVEWVRAERRGHTEEKDSSLVYRVVARSGRVFTVQSERVVVRDDAGAPRYTLGFWADITDRMRIEEELRQAQKLEAVGRLAGGVAHDFNNVLMAQRFSAEIALRQLERGDPATAAAAIAEMLAACESASDLTRQLLAFARRQVLEPEILDLNAVLAGLEQMLRRVIGDDVVLTCRFTRAPLHVSADRSQLEQVVMNLAINARDAMPGGGRLRMGLSVADEGRTAKLTVGDTGIGMDEETASRVFEPFFTTKAANGTGLGLATVHGIVVQTGGRISLRTAPGKGSTFSIVFPTAGAY